MCPRISLPVCKDEFMNLSRHFLPVLQCSAKDTKYLTVNTTLEYIVGGCILSNILTAIITFVTKHGSSWMTLGSQTVCHLLGHTLLGLGPLALVQLSIITR